jgi:hypothetical protein
LNYALDLGEADLLRRSVLAHRRVVDPTVNAPEVIRGRFRQTKDLLRHGHICRHDERATTAAPASRRFNFSRRRPQCLFVSRRQHDPCAAPPELNRRRPPDPARRARHHYHLFAQRSQHIFFTAHTFSLSPQKF